MSGLRHSLYYDARKFHVDYRTAFGRMLRSIERALLEQFKGEPPVTARLIAQRTSFKLMRAATYESAVIKSCENPSRNADLDYVTLTNSIRTDLTLLAGMAQQSAQPDTPDTPDLQKYLSLAGKKGDPNGT